MLLSFNNRTMSSQQICGLPLGTRCFSAASLASLWIFFTMVTGLMGAETALSGLTRSAPDSQIPALRSIGTNQPGLRLATSGAEIMEPGVPLDQRLLVENFTDKEQAIQVTFNLQIDGSCNDSIPPDPVLGFDHALGCKSIYTVNGKDMGDAKLCDGDPNTTVELPWNQGYQDVVTTIDLGLVRDVASVKWIAGDANWIWQVDISSSVDGGDFRPVAGAQNFDMHGRWSGPHSFPWDSPIRARQLRFRFHHEGKAENCFRLPGAIMVYDGIANDVMALPKTGRIVASGTVSNQVPVQSMAELFLKGKDPLSPGAYLLGLEVTLDGRKELRWSNLFVRPSDEVNAARARRFGINSADISVAPEMRRCGFGWVRFENAKWMMFSSAKDNFDFSGGVPPWHIDLDRIFGAYQKLGMKVLPYVFQPPEWATAAASTVEKNRSGYPPKEPSDYGQAIYQLVARYGSAAADPSNLLTRDRKTAMDRIGAVELWNEPNLNDPSWGPFVGSMSQYFEVLRTGAEGSRRADPTLPVSSAGLAGIGLDVVGQLAEHKYADGKTPLDFVDIINVHFYSGREEPEICGLDPNVDRGGAESSNYTYPDQLEDLVAWRDQHKPKAEIWLSETGNDVGGPIGRTERYQAAKVPRAVMIALAARIEKVFVYRETGSDPTMHAGAGMLRNDKSPRPVWFSMAAMMRQLQGFSGRALRLPTVDSHAWVFLWQDAGRTLIAGWTYQGAGNLGVDLGPAQVCDAFGNITSVAGTAEIVLTDMPVYITPAKLTPAFDNWVAEAKAKAAVHSAERLAKSTRAACLFDFGPESQQVGMMKGCGMPRRFTPVNKDTLWDEKKGYGFVKPALANEEHKWVGDPLERDACRIEFGTPFRFALPPGRFKLRISAEPAGAATGEVVVKTATNTLQKQVGNTTGHIAEFIIPEGNAPVEVTLNGYGLLHWITAIAESP
jgi:hypothetical protein